ncbi:hypothetical protein [Mycobacterium sp.]|uniref:hypothetical protein n=1 Tax=Mycobacterium sp. TaxID=1785 RepID=UPI002D198D90|nr:hypothetical protein [Mycobacterium sp.]HTY32091.1 hypothetical protein [Mycobacterium sp.]
MATLNAEQPGGWRYQPGTPLPQDDSPAPFTINGLTEQQIAQQRQAQAAAAAARGGTADRLYAGLVSVARMQADHNAAVDAKAKRQPNFYPPERVKAEVNGEEPGSESAILIAAMKQAVDAADQPVDVPVIVAQSRIDEIHNALVNTHGDAAQESRNIRTRDRVLRRLQTAEDTAARASIARGSGTVELHRRAAYRHWQQKAQELLADRGSAGSTSTSTAAKVRASITVSTS